MRSFLLIIFFLIVGMFSVHAQEELPDCTHPQEVKLSVYENTFNKNDSLETIYYQEEDAYTFWYKLTVDGDGEIMYALRKLNSNDEYEVMYYEYKGNNFCNDLMKQKVKPRSGSAFKVKTGFNYYISVLHVSGKGCGHQMEFNSTFHTKHFTAIQNTCVEEIAEEIQQYDIESIHPKYLNSLELDKTHSTITINDSQKNVLPAIITNKNNSTKPLSIIGTVVNAKTLLPINVAAQFTLSDSSFFLNNHPDQGFSITAARKKHPVKIVIHKFGYKPMEQIFTINNDTNLMLYLHPIEVGEKIVSHRIYFHPNTPILKEESKTELEKIQQFLKENSDIVIEIQGHTNGNRRVKKDKKFAHLNDEWNYSGTAKELSQLRAEKVKKHLEENGINSDQITAKGYGGDKMIVEKPKNMKEAMKNIRVEIVVIEQIKQ